MGTNDLPALGGGLEKWRVSRVAKPGVLYKTSLQKEAHVGLHREKRFCSRISFCFSFCFSFL